jgi:hypothetical protein
MALSAMRVRSRVRGEPSTRNGSARPAVSFTPTPAASALAAARDLGFAPALAANAALSARISSMSLWAPPTASTSSTGFRPTNAAANTGE